MNLITIIPHHCRITFLLLLLLLWLYLMEIGHEVLCGALIAELLIIAGVTALVFAASSDLTFGFIGTIIQSEFVSTEGAILGICLLRLQLLLSMIELIIWHMNLHIVLMLGLGVLDSMMVLEVLRDRRVGVHLRWKVLAWCGHSHHL